MKTVRGEAEIGMMLAGVLLTAVVVFSIAAGVIFSRSSAEQCAAACGTGRFKSWTDRVIAPPGAINTPEKCECTP